MQLGCPLKLLFLIIIFMEYTYNIQHESIRELKMLNANVKCNECENDIIPKGNNF